MPDTTEGKYARLGVALITFIALSAATAAEYVEVDPDTFSIGTVVEDYLETTTE